MHNSDRPLPNAFAILRSRHKIYGSLILTHIFIRLPVHKQTRTHTSTRARRHRQAKQYTMHQRTQICLHSRLWTLFFMLLLITMLPSPCRGAYTNAHSQSVPHSNPASYNANLDPHTTIIPNLFLSQTLPRIMQTLTRTLSSFRSTCPNI